MSEHQWFPVDAVQDHSSALQFTYRNELGEEHIHVIENFSFEDNTAFRGVG